MRPRTPTPIRTDSFSREMYSQSFDTPELSSASTANTSSALNSPDTYWDFEHNSVNGEKDSFAHFPRYARGPRDLDELLHELSIPEYKPVSQKKGVSIFELVGEGTHAKVHRALLNGRQVAAKIASSKSANVCLKRELEVLDHICTESVDLDHIIEHYALENVGGREALFLELATSDLMTEIDSSLESSRDGRAPVTGQTRWYALARQIQAAIVALHDIGVVHGDIKPQNFLVTSKDYLKLSDFECAYTPSGPLSRHVAAQFDIVGSTAYSAPELLSLKNAEASFESDIFALGVTLLVLATGEEPYSRARTGIQQIIQSRSGDPIRFSDRTRLTAPIETIIKGCCAKDPASRWTHERIAEALKQF